MRRSFVAAVGVVCAAVPIFTGACSAIAGYEDLRLAPSSNDTSEGGATHAGDAGVIAPLDLGTATVYSVYAPIFSASGNLAGVMAQLPRIHALGFNVLSLMPVTPLGAPTASHPASIGSPYCVHDYYGVNASQGSPLDLTALVRAAHQLGMYVVLDEEVNHTSWDNPLITQHPEFYVHSGANKTDPTTIVGAFTFPDVAQLDYQTPSNGLAKYMTTMLAYWLTTYGVDGFRFLTVDVPQGSPTIPQSFWQSLRTSLVATKADVVLWGDQEDPAYAGKPFALDQGWLLRGGTAGTSGDAGLQQVANGASASLLQASWQAQTTGYDGVKHVALLENWDFDSDLKVYGGLAGTMASAAFDFLIDGVPLLWNGEEVGNDQAGPDTSQAIDWTSPDATTLTPFYTSLLTLRNGYSALQTGSVTWLTTTAPDQVSAFLRSDASGTFLVAINFASATTSATVTVPAGVGANGWTDVSPTGSPGGTTHASPPALALAPFDFAVFAAH